jgi:hypothetical protein
MLYADLFRKLVMPPTISHVLAQEDAVLEICYCYNVAYYNELIYSLCQLVQRKGDVTIVTPDVNLKPVGCTFVSQKQHIATSYHSGFTVNIKGQLDCNTVGVLSSQR